jgi:hypothetical protein
MTVRPGHDQGRDWDLRIVAATRRFRFDVAIEMSIFSPRAVGIGLMFRLRFPCRPFLCSGQEFGNRVINRHL